MYRSRLRSAVRTGCKLIQADDLECWIISLTVLGESIYAGGENCIILAHTIC